MSCLFGLVLFLLFLYYVFFSSFFFSSRRRHTRCLSDWSSDVCSSDLRTEKVNLAQKFSLFTSHWDPKIVGEVNGHHVKLVKFQGPFVWHRHEKEDELDRKSVV